MKRRISVVALQMKIKPLDIQANLEKAEKMLKKVFEKNNCDLVVFPEYCITGPIPRNLELAQDNNEGFITYFKQWAVEFNTYIVCGSFVKKIENKFYNTSLLINNKGKVILEYQKNNLWHPEKKYLTSGTTCKVVKTQLGKIGIIICWDLAFPDTFKSLVKQGVEIICCPSYWIENDGKKLARLYRLGTEKTFVNTLCPARSIENEVLFIYANGAGIAKVPLKTKLWRSLQIGQTQICTPIFGTVKRINDNSEGFIIYEYDRQIAKNTERNYKIREELVKK